MADCRADGDGHVEASLFPRGLGDKPRSHHAGKIIRVTRFRGAAVLAHCGNNMIQGLLPTPVVRALVSTAVMPGL